MFSKISFLAATVGLSLATHSPAATTSFGISGGGISGTIHLTYAPNPSTGVLGTSPNVHDPVGSYIVTGASGHFVDTLTGINTTISGIVASNPSNPEPANLLAPHSFGFYPVVSGIDHGDVIAPGFSYDNLYYPGGSPQTASDYPFHGGVLDIYGLVFKLGNGDAFNFWSNGFTPGPATPIYGVGITDGRTVLNYVNGISLNSVPEPATWTMMIFGIGAVGMTLRTRRRVALA